MIRIKNMIFDKSDIVFIEKVETGIRVCPKTLNVSIKEIKDATFDDIEWNYDNLEKIQADKLSEELNNLANDYSLVVAECKKYKEKFGKARKYMFLNANYNEYMGELLSGLSVDNCNELLKIIDGE